MHTIKFVANHTGLSPHTIRSWERRYAVLSPDRTATNRRLYTVEDMEKLSLLHRAVLGGHSIGQIATLSVSELKGLLIEERTKESALPKQMASAAGAYIPHSYLEECLNAVERWDADALEYALTRAAAMLGTVAMLDQVMLPLLERIGEDWREGDVRPAQEHMASAVMRTFLGRTLAAFQPPAQAPRLIVTTPIRQLHELGALIAAVTAASEGWRVLYLGANLPAEEIAGAAYQSHAGAIALSIVYPPDDPTLAQELDTLRRSVGPEMSLLVGGRASANYTIALQSVGAIRITDMSALRRTLESLRVG